jgi:hypothetical protein
VSALQRPPAAVLSITKARTKLREVSVEDAPNPSLLSACAAMLEAVEHVIHALGEQPPEHSQLKSGVVKLVEETSPFVILSLDAAAIRLRVSRSHALAMAIDLLRESVGARSPSSAPPALPPSRPPVAEPPRVFAPPAPPESTFAPTTLATPPVAVEPDPWRAFGEPDFPGAHGSAGARRRPHPPEQAPLASTYRAAVGRVEITRRGRS